MHIEAQDFCYRASKITGPVATALDVGGRNVNGTVRDCWVTHWTGLDVEPGPGVDLVQDACDPIDGHWSLVLSTEMLEHCKHPRLALHHMAQAATEWVLVTCATTGRAPHSAIDGGPLRDGEHYANVFPEQLRHPMLETVLLEIHDDRGDLFFLGKVRNG